MPSVSPLDGMARLATLKFVRPVTVAFADVLLLNSSADGFGVELSDVISSEHEVKARTDSKQR